MKRGFTLIELMIVVAILGILAAIAVSKIAKVAACANSKTSSKCQRFLAKQNGVDAPDTVTVNGITYGRVK